MWVQIDNDRSADLSLDEFELGIVNHNINLDKQEIEALFTQYDTNGNGRLDYNEFLVKLRVCF